MKEVLALLSNERGLVRRAALLSIGLVAFTLAAGQGVIALISKAIPDRAERISANATPPQAVTRNYTVTRSVMDNAITTGSITPRPAGVKVDPCKN